MKIAKISYIFSALSEALLHSHERQQADNAEQRRKFQLEKQEKHQTPSKVWMEKAANVDYEVPLPPWVPVLFKILINILNPEMVQGVLHSRITAR